MWRYFYIVVKKEDVGRLDLLNGPIIAFCESIVLTKWKYANRWEFFSKDIYGVVSGTVVGHDDFRFFRIANDGRKKAL